MPASDVTLLDIHLARQTIEPIARRTPLVHSPLLTECLAYSESSKTSIPTANPDRKAVYLKLENLQVTGSFKVRGAANKMLNLTAEEKSRGRWV